MLAKFRNMITNKYSITVKQITSRNPGQPNAILERVQQTIGNVLHTFKIHNMVLGDNIPWDGILSYTMFAPRPTVHTTTQYTPAQPVFGRDSILNRCHDVDWEAIKKRKQNLINKDNAQNWRCKIHTCQTGNKGLLNKKCAWVPM